MSEACNGRACNFGAVLPRDSVLSRLVRCLCGSLDEQPCCRLLIIVKCTEVSGGGGVDDLRQTRLQELLREKACQDCVTDHAKCSWLGRDEGSQMSRGLRCLALS